MSEVRRVVRSILLFAFIVFCLYSDVYLVKEVTRLGIYEPNVFIIGVGFTLLFCIVVGIGIASWLMN